MLHIQLHFFLMTLQQVIVHQQQPTPVNNTAMVLISHAVKTFKHALSVQRCSGLHAHMKKFICNENSLQINSTTGINIHTCNSHLLIHFLNFIYFKHITLTNMTMSRYFFREKSSTVPVLLFCSSRLIP